MVQDGEEMGASMLATLEFENKAIRLVGTQETPEWVAADVCGVLGIDLPSNVLRRFKQSEKGVCLIDISGQKREMLTVTEPGLYRLIFKSRKPEAERFRTWLTHDVLPCLRKHGCYPEPAVEVGGNAVVSVDAEQFCIQMGKAIHAATFSAVKPLADKVDRVEGKVDDLSHRVGLIENRVNLTAKTKRRHIYVVGKYYSGQCPCCRTVRIVNEHGERLQRLQFDHWFRRSEAGADKTWAVCVDCNQSLRDGDWKQTKAVQFEAYQGCRRECDQAIAGPLLDGMDE